MDANINIENKADKNGNMNIMGVNVSIGDIVGKKIAEQFIAKLTPEEMDALTDFLKADIFTKKYGTDVTVVKNNNQWKVDNIHDTGYRSSYSLTETYTLAEHAKDGFARAISEDLLKKIDEIVETDEYKNKIDSMAHEILDYAVEGYKKDLLNRIKERLVGNVLKPNPYYDNETIETIAKDALMPYIDYRTKNNN